MSSRRSSMTTSISLVTRGCPYRMAAVAPVTIWGAPSHSNGAVNSAIKSGTGMQDAAGDFPAALFGGEMRVALAQPGIHERPDLLLHRDRDLQFSLRRHPAID